MKQISHQLGYTRKWYLYSRYHIIGTCSYPVQLWLSNLESLMYCQTCCSVHRKHLKVVQIKKSNLLLLKIIYLLSIFFWMAICWDMIGRSSSSNPESPLCLEVFDVADPPLSGPLFGSTSFPANLGSVLFTMWTWFFPNEQPISSNHLHHKILFKQWHHCYSI